MDKIIRKITFSVAIDTNVYDLIPKIKQDMQNKGLSSFSNGSISRGDAISYCIKKYGESIGFEVNNNGLDLEFITSDQIQDRETKSMMETQLCNILSSGDFSILEKYRLEECESKGIDVFDFCDDIGIDWNKTIIDRKIVYIKEES